MDDHIKETILDKEAQKKLANLKRVKARYQRIKDDPDFKAYNRAAQKKAYDTNPEYRQKKIDDYYNNKKLHNDRSLYNWWKRRGRLNEFIEKHPDKYKYLCSVNDRYRVKFDVGDDIQITSSANDISEHTS